jgi:hypothetical protein
MGLPAGSTITPGQQVSRAERHIAIGGAIDIRAYMYVVLQGDPPLEGPWAAGPHVKGRGGHSAPAKRVFGRHTLNKSRRTSC